MKHLVTIAAFAIVFAAIEGGAVGEKKFGSVKSSIPFQQEFIIDDPTVTAPQATSFATSNSQHLLRTDNGSGANNVIRAYVPAGVQWMINKFAVTATDTIPGGSSCKISLAKNGVRRVTSSINVAQSGSTDPVAQCDERIDDDGDGRLEIDGDSCLRSGGITNYSAGDYLTVSVQSSGLCTRLETVSVMIDGTVSIP